MKNKFLPILGVCLLTGPPMAVAELVESTTGVMLTFRPCNSGATVCDSIGPPQVSRFGGLPGELSAIARHVDPEYGEASGTAKLTGPPGAARMSASSASLPATRNGASSVICQRYTNTSAHAQTLTFSATLIYDQMVPVANADFPADGPARSGANAEIVILSIDADALDAGTTAESNTALLMEGPDPSITSRELGHAGTEPSSNVTETGTKTISSTATVEPGDSVWLMAILQSLTANGAKVSATLDTKFESIKSD